MCKAATCPCFNNDRKTQTPKMRALEMREMGRRKPVTDFRDPFGLRRSLNGFSDARADVRKLGSISGEMWRAFAQLSACEASVGACIRILSGLVLRGGIVAKRGSQPVELTPEFQSHLNTVWLEFARDIIHSTLILGGASRLSSQRRGATGW